jgi:hypothetical protein
VHLSDLSLLYFTALAIFILSFKIAFIGLSLGTLREKR